ncbi:hypothetical protein BBK77_012085 [Agrobacterium vitis]|nr:hypothetical protein [Agrobacterium vitis]
MLIMASNICDIADFGSAHVFVACHVAAAEGAARRIFARAKNQRRPERSHVQNVIQSVDKFLAPRTRALVLHVQKDLLRLKNITCKMSSYLWIILNGDVRVFARAKIQCDVSRLS